MHADCERSDSRWRARCKAEHERWESERRFRTVGLQTHLQIPKAAHELNEGVKRVLGFEEQEFVGQDVRAGHLYPGRCRRRGRKPNWTETAQRARAGR